jgi:protein MBA1
VAPSPKVNFERAQTNTEAMAEDIGLFQNTIVRAPFKELWKEAHGIRGVLGYYWNIVKHKGTAIYS